MRILVCAKQVPNTNEVKIDPVKGTLIRDGVESILNPDDANALEEALRIRDSIPGSSVTVLSMGPMQADYMLRECLAMGADEAILLSDRAFAGADTWATSNALAAAIRRMEPFDIIFAGRQAIDGDTAQVGPQIAERLGIPQVTYVQRYEIEGDHVKVERQLEDGYQVITAPMPVLLTAVKGLNTPRYMRVGGIYEAYEEKEVQIWTVKDIPVDPSQVGIDAAPTKVFRSFAPDPKGAGIQFVGTPKELAAQLIDALKAKHIV